MRNEIQTVATIDLDHEQMLILDGGREGRVRVLCGATWLTGEGEAGDTVLRAGSEHALGKGRVLIGGLGPAQVQIAIVAGGLSARLTWWLGSVLRAARSQLARLQLGPGAYASRS